MYALGEELDYDALKITAHAKLYTHLVQRHNHTPSAVKDVVEATFAPPGDAARMCKDDDLVLQQLAVASVLDDFMHRHEFRGLHKPIGFE